MEPKIVRALRLAKELVGNAPSETWWHGVSKNKLSRPLEEMSAKTIEKGDLLPRKYITPADVEGGTLISALGDRTAAGKYLTEINERPLAFPVDLEGGPNFKRALAAQGPDKAAWASQKSIISRLANIARENPDPYLAYTAMSNRAGDYSTIMTDALLSQLPESKILKKDVKLFDKAMKEHDPQWLGLMDADLRDYLLSKGPVRTRFAETVAQKPFQAAGLPDIGSTRFAITEPELLNVPTGSSGYAISKLDPSGKVIADPVHPHSTYEAQLGGEGYVGGFKHQLPLDVMYPNWISQQTPELLSNTAKRDYKFKLDMPTQSATPEWVDTTMKWLRENYPEAGYAAGGAIEHALRLARETGGYIPVSKRKHFDDGGDAGGGDGNGGDGGASSDAGNGNGDTGGGSGDNGASSDAGNGMGGAESSAAADTASAAESATQDAAQASDVGSLGAGNAPSTDATQSAAEASDIGGLGSAAATSEVGQAAAAQSAANANADMDAATEAATSEVSEEADLASPNATPTAMTNAQMVGAILGALAPVPGGAAIGYGIGSMMGGQQATTARDSNTPDATGVTGGNAGNGPSAADLGASSSSGYGGSSFGGEGGGAGGNEPSKQSTESPDKEQPKQISTPYVAPIIPSYTPQNIDYSDLGAANSISRQKLGSNLFNDALINPIYAQPQKNGGRVFKNNAVDNALKIAMVLAHKMEENPLLEDKIRSILLKL